MAQFRSKGKKDVPGISTSSLPDIIFMLLFFFMVSTTMREQEVLIQYTLPTATEIQKLENKSLASFIYIGSPAPHLVGMFGTSPRIQLNDSFRTAPEIGQFIAAERDKLAERDRPLLTVTLKADQNVRMGIITDVKQELRKASALRIVYAASQGRGYE
ncbi:MAG: biopolymer transporter ExbD [Rikenellaceae bacterium]|nr:biopolymer transporter ExbD [Rikenellaceae bacterium]